MLLLLYWLSLNANATTLPDTVKTGKEYLKLAQQQEALDDQNQAIEYNKLAESKSIQEGDQTQAVYAMVSLASLYTTSDATDQAKAKLYLGRFDIHCQS